VHRARITGCAPGAAAWGGVSLSPGMFTLWRGRAGQRLEGLSSTDLTRTGTISAQRGYAACGAQPIG
jgi:hypothetical protein